MSSSPFTIVSQKRDEDFLRSTFRSSLLEAADLPAQLGFVSLLPHTTCSE